MSFRAALLSGVILIPVSAAHAAEIEAVEVFDAGLAWMTHAIDPAMGDTVLSIPRDRMNAFLGSFTVTGQGFAAPKLSFVGPDMPPGGLSGLPLSPGDITSAERLLAALAGHHVTLDTLDGPRAGAVMGVSERRGCGEGVCADLMLRESGSGSTRIVAMEAVQAISIDDPDLSAQLDLLLAQIRQRRDDEVREIRISFGSVSEGAAGVAGYMVPAEPWRVTWRIFLQEEARGLLQGWAVVRNDTGQDWTDVALTLSSGSPHVIPDHLFAPPDLRRESARSQSFTMRGALSAEATMDMAALAPAPIAPGVEASDGDISSRYSLPEPITLPAGRMASLPLIEQALPDIRMSRHRGQGRQMSRPAMAERVLQVRNDLDLRIPEGIASVSGSTDGYLGNARIPAMLPGEERLIGFGTDDRVTVLEAVRQDRTSESVRLQGGILLIEERETMETRYRIDLRGGVRGILLIDHPDRGEAWTAPEVADIEVARHVVPGEAPAWRVPVTLDADSASRTVVVRESRPIRSRVALGDLEPDQIMAWSGRAVDTETEAVLRDYMALLRASRSADSALEALRREAAMVTEEQRRRMTLMNQFAPGSDEFRRFSGEIVALEDRLQDLWSREEGLASAADDRRDRLSRFLEEIGSRRR